MLIPPHNWGLVERGLSRSGLPTALNLEFLAKQRIRTIVYLAAPSAEDEDEEEEEDGRAGGRSKLDPALLTFLNEQHVELIQLGGAVPDSDATTDSSSGVGGVGKDGGGGVGSKPTVAVSSSHHQHLRHHLSGWKPTSEELVLSALGHVLDPKLYPLHLMCSSSGRHLTGVLVGCFRKLQRWSLSSIFAEYRRYAGGASNTRGAEDGGNELVRNEQFIELFDVELLQATIGQRSLAKHMKQLNIAVTPQAQQAAQQAQQAQQAQAAAIAAAQAQAAAASSNAAVATASSNVADRKVQQPQAPLSSRASTPSAAAAPFSSAAASTALPAPSPSSAAAAPAPAQVPAASPLSQRPPPSVSSTATPANHAGAMPTPAASPAATAAASSTTGLPSAIAAGAPAAVSAALPPAAGAPPAAAAPAANAHIGAPPSTSAR